MKVTKIYTKEDIYNDMLFKNRDGKGEIYKIKLKHYSERSVYLVGVNTHYDNKDYPMSSLIDLFNKGTYVEQPAEIIQPIINDKYSVI